jgi:tetratricopeptide (TPR) repeat protein
MIRGRKPRLDLAEQRLGEIASQDPTNTEIQLLIAELRIALRAPPEAIASVYHEAQQRAPTPEVFHAEATWHQYKPSGRSRAATALERGIAAFGESGRMRRRLAGIYLDQNRNDDAIAQLQEAMRLEPMMPDTYGILGELYLIRGAFEQAEQSLEEARRLDPENGLHMARLGALLIELGQADRQVQAEQLLEGAIQKDKRNYLAHLYLALVVLSRADGDLERADWLLKQASKMDERAARPLAERARIAVRRKNWVEASSLLDKAQKLEPSCHEAWYARGELFEAQGLIFNANPTYLRALELSPKGSKARSLYETAVQRTGELITSGAAVEMQKQAEEAGLLAPAPQPKGGAQRTVRRRRDQGNNAEVSGSDAVVDGSSATVEESQETAAADPAEAADEVVAEAEADAE